MSRASCDLLRALIGLVLAGLRELLRALHVGDVFEPINPAGFVGRLQRAGFGDPMVDSNGDRFRFRARSRC